MASPLTVGSLFSGIGGIDLGLERAGMVVRWQIENDPWCQRVLAKHWPDVRRYGDIREVDANALERVDLIAGGFPCQPVSFAGKRLEQADERWLWPEFARVIRAVRPRYVLVENVPGLLTGGIGDVLGDMAACGYDAEWQSLPAAAFGAPHIRERVWIVAYARCTERWARYTEGRHFQRQQHLYAKGSESAAGAGERSQVFADADCSWQLQPNWSIEKQRGWIGDSGWWCTEPGMGRVAYGVPESVDRLRGLGNAVVPAIVEWLGRRIIEAHHA